MAADDDVGGLGIVAVVGTSVPFPSSVYFLLMLKKADGCSIFQSQDCTEARELKRGLIAHFAYNKNINK